MLSRREMRLRRKKRIRKKVAGTPERPRLSVFRSAKHIYVQVIDDTKQATLASASTLKDDLKEMAEAQDGLTKKAAARCVGELVARRCLEKNIEQVVFDRNGFIYHGRVLELADAARKAGLKF
jgi:large subunit ribosomal protein L18